MQVAPLLDMKPELQSLEIFSLTLYYLIFQLCNSENLLFLSTAPEKKRNSSSKHLSLDRTRKRTSRRLHLKSSPESEGCMCALIGREGAALQPIALKGTPRWVLMSCEIGPIARRPGPLNGCGRWQRGGKGGGGKERARES